MTPLDNAMKSKVSSSHRRRSCTRVTNTVVEPFTRYALRTPPPTHSYNWFMYGILTGGSIRGRHNGRGGLVDMGQRHVPRAAGPEGGPGGVDGGGAAEVARRGKTSHRASSFPVYNISGWITARGSC